MNRRPVPLNAEQQHQLLLQIAQSIASVASPGWRQVRADYRAMGRHVEVDVVVTGSDGTPVLVSPPGQVMPLLGSLRSAAYRRGRGTWFGMSIVVAPSGPLEVEYLTDAEPYWRRDPPVQAYRDELEFFPRDAEFLPDWLRQAAEGGQEVATDLGTSTEPHAVPEAGLGNSSGELRMSKVYDGLGGDGRPVVNRSPLDPAEKGRVLDYLGGAPVVLAARSYGTDAFDPGRPPSVPLTFRTDGVWVWPGAVAYYLREHDVAPDSELLAHIRRRDYAVPDVGEDARQRAAELVTGQER